MIKTAIKTSILSCDEVTSFLAKWEFTTGVESAAVFTVDPLPTLTPRPCIQVMEQSSDLNTLRGSNGMRVIVEVRLLGNKADSSAFLSGLAVALWRYLSNATLTVSGYSFCGADVFYPVPLLDSDDFPGYGIIIDAQFLSQGGW